LDFFQGQITIDYSDMDSVQIEYMIKARTELLDKKEKAAGEAVSRMESKSKTTEPEEIPIGGTRKAIRSLRKTMNLKGPK